MRTTRFVPHQTHPTQNHICGGQPSPEQLKAASEHGVVTVINMRGDKETLGFDEAALVSSLGMSYLTFPIEDPSWLTPERIRAFDRLLAEAPTPAILHCGSGNRIGALFALRAAWIQGHSIEDALRIGRGAGLTSLETFIHSQLRSSSEAVR